MGTANDLERSPRRGYLAVTVRVTADVGAESVEYTAVIVVDRPSHTNVSRVEVVDTDQSPSEQPAVVTALAEWVAEGMTTLPFEKIKEGLTPAGHTWHIDATADFLERANDQVHGFVGDAAQHVTSDTAALPPVVSEAAGSVAELGPLPHDNLIDPLVTSLRLMSMAIDIASGGLPVAGLVELLLDGIKKDIADSIGSALISQPPRREVLEPTPHQHDEVGLFGHTDDHQQRRDDSVRVGSETFDLDQAPSITVTSTLGTYDDHLGPPSIEPQPADQWTSPSAEHSEPPSITAGNRFEDPSQTALDPEARVAARSLSRM